jgi:DMSO/TMAO reductase YedYZ molybdopterin-dependent catalytic subunit
MAAPFGAPVRLHISTKLGFKNPKSIIAIEVTNKWTGGYWANQGYNWFSGSLNCAFLLSLPCSA